jgi:hypothetical protein
MKLFAIALGAVALAGTAYAASPKTHVMNVALPDGSVARVEYVGDTAPKVSVAPAAAGPWAGGLMPGFAGFDRMFEEMDRQAAAMLRQVQQVGAEPGRAGLNVAGFGNMPAGADSVSVVSYSSGGATCTRTTEVVSQGAGKPPKVTTNVSGNCAGSPEAAPAPAPETTGPITRT